MIVLPRVVRLFEEYEREGLRVVAVHAAFREEDDKTIRNVARFAKEAMLPFPVALDLKGDGLLKSRTADRYHVESTPEFVIADREGVIRFVGNRHTKEREMTERVVDLLGK